MKQFFDTQIKPFNDQLAKELATTIPVICNDKPQTIKVRISYTSHTGNRVTRFAGQTSFYRSMGLMI